MKVYKLLRAAICLIAALVAVPTFAAETTASPEKDKVFLIDKYDGTDGTYIYENGGKLSVGASSTANAQYWRFIPTGTADRYYIQNVVTGNYIQSTKIETSAQVSTGTSPVVFEVKKGTSGATDGFYYMCSTDQDNITTESDATLGLNNGSTNGVVAFWIKAGRGNSYWKLTEATDSYTGDIKTTSPAIAVGTAPTWTKTSVMENSRQTSTFTQDVSIDWSTQKLVAKVNATGAASGNYCVLNIGANNSSTGPNIYVMYNTSSKQFTVGSNGITNGIYYGNQSVGNSNHTLEIEISKEKGVYVNGNKCNYYYSTTTERSGSDFTELWALSTVKVSNKCSDANAGTATFNYIRIVDKDNTTNDGAVVGTTLVTLAEGSSNADNISANEGKQIPSITLTRELVADQWNTFCVPFSVPESAMSSLGDVVIKKYDSVSGTAMKMTDATSIEAGKPYLIKPTEKSIKNPVFSYATISAKTPTTVGSSTYAFRGVYDPYTFSDSETSTSYILVTNGQLVNPNAGTMKGLRGYFTCTSTSGVAPRLVIDGVETDLSEVVGSEAITDGRIYNLRGIYVGNDASRLAKGIYIVNGKKVVLK
jgi:uncharacterized protein (DUF779 family)